jgi:hypothetical protein
MFRKAQAAMEFLMTYGWAILVVLAAIGALAFFGVFKLDNFMKNKCTIPAGMDCVEDPVIGANTVQFKIANNMGDNITIVDIQGDSTGDCTANDAVPMATGTGPNGDIADGTTSVITYTHGLGLSAGAKIKCKFSIRYYQGSGGLLHPTSVDISGRVS